MHYAPSPVMSRVTGQRHVGGPIHAVNSTAISALSYSGRRRELSVWFHSNPHLEYIYVNVPLFIVGAIFRSASKGKALNRHIIDKVEFTRRDHAAQRA